jgi:hypothetical protein
VLLRPGVVIVYTGGVPATKVAPLLTDQTVTVRRDRATPCAELAACGTCRVPRRSWSPVANLVPNAIINTDRDPVDFHGEKFFEDFGRFGSIAGLFALIVGACSLAAGLLGILAERGRSHSCARRACGRGSCAWRCFWRRPARWW